MNTLYTPKRRNCHCFIEKDVFSNKYTFFVIKNVKKLRKNGKNHGDFNVQSEHKPVKFFPHFSKN